MSNLHDLEWGDGPLNGDGNDTGDNDDDDLSFKSALDSSITESFLAYSMCHDPKPMSFDFIHQVITDASSSDADYDDAFSQARSEDFSICDDDDGHEDDDDDDDLSYDTDSQHEDHRGEASSNANLAVSPSSSSTATANTPSKSHQTKKHKKTSSKRPTITSLTFNQDKDCIAISTNVGYQIQTIEPNPHEPYQIHEVPVPPPSESRSAGGRSSRSRSGTSLVQILHRTSLLAIVKRKTPRVLSIIHARTAKLVKELSFTSAVRRVEMNRLSVVVLTANGQLHVFVYKKAEGGVSGGGAMRAGLAAGDSTTSGDIEFVRTMSILHESESPRMMTAKPATTQGAFFDLSSYLVGEGGDSWLVTKSAEGLGSVAAYKISGCSGGGYDGASMELVYSLFAHHHGIGRIAIGGDGVMDGVDVEQKVFATASMQGTIIRVFSLLQGQKLYELQRGSSPCTIFSLAFNIDATVLSVSGSKGTTHLFQLSEENRVDHQPTNESESARKSIKEGLSKIMKRFTSKSKDDGEQMIRSFCRIRLKAERPIAPNTIAMLKPTYTEEAEREENVMICLGSGNIFQFAVLRSGKSRPIRADDLLFRKNCD